MKKVLNCDKGRPVTLDEVEEAQVFKQDILSRLRSGTIEDDEIDILMPALQSRIDGKTPIVGVSLWKTAHRILFRLNI